MTAFAGKTLLQLLRKVRGKTLVSNDSNIKPMHSIYDIPLTDLHGRPETLSDYKGKKILIVNTASKCGFTPQYAKLEELHKTMGGKIAVLGFPCNDFAGQEPGSEADIQNFCTVNYGVTFPMFSKVHVTGAEKHPLYRWLTDASENGWNTQEPTWNFCKFLVDENGTLLHYFSSSVDPFDERITG